MPRRFALALLVGYALPFGVLAGCSDATPEATPTLRPAVRPDTSTPAPLSDSARTARGMMAEASAAAFVTAGGDASASCAEATGAAAAFRDAGRTAEAARWQARADSACAALEPQLEATMARITDSLAAARRN